MTDLCQRCSFPGVLLPVRYRDEERMICRSCVLAIANKRLGADEVEALEEFSARMSAGSSRNETCAAFQKRGGVE